MNNKGNDDAVRNKYIKYIEEFNLNEEEFKMFLFNFYDSVAFNRYLGEDFLKYDFNSEDNLVRLRDFFEKKHVNKELAKEIFIAYPMILSSKNFDKDIKILYDDSDMKGISITDKDGNCHLYGRNENYRNLMEVKDKSKKVVKR